jgi:hypothetical protein
MEALLSKNPTVVLVFLLFITIMRIRAISHRPRDALDRWRALRRKEDAMLSWRDASPGVNKLGDMTVEMPT